MNDPNDLARLQRQQTNADHIRAILQAQQVARLHQEQARAAEYQRQQLNLLRAHQGLPPIPSPEEVAEEERRVAEAERAARRDAKHREIEATWPQDQRILGVAAGVLVVGALGRAWGIAGIAAVVTGLYLWRVVAHFAWRRDTGASEGRTEADVEAEGEVAGHEAEAGAEVEVEVAGHEVERVEAEVVPDVATATVEHLPHRTDRSPALQRPKEGLLLEQAGRGDRRTRLFRVPPGAMGFTVAWDCPEDGWNGIKVRRPPDESLDNAIWVCEPTRGESYFYEQGDFFLDIDSPAWLVEVREPW